MPAMFTISRTGRPLSIDRVVTILVAVEVCLGFLSTLLAFLVRARRWPPLWRLICGTVMFHNALLFWTLPKWQAFGEEVEPHPDGWVSGRYGWKQPNSPNA